MARARAPAALAVSCEDRRHSREERERSCRIVACPFVLEVVRLVEDTASKAAGDREVPRGFESLRLHFRAFAQ
jgi:hypothetical protein